MLQNAYLKTKELVETFKANEAHYLSPSYVEARVRQDFIDKLFTALGWDVLHDFQKNPFEQEVKVEKPQRQEGHQAQKRADYAFYLAPDFKKVQFFVEAKKPSRTLRQNRDDYFQTAKYGWNSQTGISILTDFEEIVMIDCRFKPDFDTILSNEIKYYKYLDLLEEEKFSEFYWLFSREALEAGNLTKFVESLPQPKGKAKQLKLFGGRYQSIDDSFLDYIDDIRLQMAQAFYQNNPTLDHYDLTEATQRTIDRLVFIRFLEDKQIEPEDLMHGISTSDHPWRKFIELSKRLDAKYNGVVFKEHFIDKNAFLGANEELFKSIAQDLDHTATPYDFNYIPIHILGNIYERFLGKIIAVEDGKARIELKPEVRKAGGVFYTPKYIVDYIVENTVGKKITGKKPKEIAKLKFADIACGSGSFLIGVYDYLLDYYKIYYNQNPEEAKKDGCKYDTENQIWVLSIKQKQQILLDNVFGVDIDLQATEVSQVSLFLKLLEDETMATANDMNVLFAEKILPDLSGNIKCGNSLIGYEIMDGVLEFGKEEMRKLNPFDFEQAFPTVFSSKPGTKQSGFDAIVGNPPYVKEYTDNSAFINVKKGKLQKYYQGKMDLWYFFACYSLDLLNSNGLLGYIIPNNWVSNAGASILRNKVIKDAQIKELIDFRSFMVFDDASIQTMIMILENNSKSSSYNFNYQYFNNKKLSHLDVEDDLKNIDKNHSVSQNINLLRDNYLNKFLKFDNSEIEEILEKIKSKSNFQLDSKQEVAQGIVPNPDVLSKKSFENYYSNLPNYSVGEPVFVIPNNYLQNLTENEKRFLKPLYEPYELSRYFFPNGHQKEIIYLTKKNDSSDIDNLINHLQKFKEVTNERRETKTGKLKNYHLHWPRDSYFFEKGSKILSVRKCEIPTFVFTEEESFVMMSINVIKSDRIDLKYLLGILNSRVIMFWLKCRGKMQGEIFQVDKEPLLEIPIHNTANQPLHDALVKLVEQMLQAKKDEQNAVTDHDKNFYRNLIQSLDNRINKAVYQLYNLTEEEIALVENSN